MSNKLSNILKVDKGVSGIGGEDVIKDAEIINDVDREFVELLDRTISRLYPMYFQNKPIDHTAQSQKQYVAMMEEVLSNCTEPDGKLLMSSDVPDHRRREMRQFIMYGNKFHYVIDVYATLEVSLQISKFKRFVLTHIPESLVKYSNDNIVPKIVYKLRVWNTSSTNYELHIFSCDLNVPYSSSIERDRSLIGTPHICTPKERRYYDRLEFYTRRALFNDFNNVQQKRSSGRRS